MKTFISFTVALGALSIKALAMPCQPTSGTLGAAYFMTNDLTCNQLVVNQILADGTLAFSTALPTGGKGGHGVDGNNTTGPDGLFSQGSVRTGDGMVFVANGMAEPPLCRDQ